MIEHERLRNGRGIPFLSSTHCSSLNNFNQIIVGIGNLKSTKHLNHDIDLLFSQKKISPSARVFSIRVGEADDTFNNSET